MSDKPAKFGQLKAKTFTFNYFFHLHQISLKTLVCFNVPIFLPTTYLLQSWYTFKLLHYPLNISAMKQLNANTISKVLILCALLKFWIEPVWAHFSNKKSKTSFFTCHKKHSVCAISSIEFYRKSKITHLVTWWSLY